MKVFSLIALLLITAIDAKPLQMDVRAKSAILMNAESGAILFEKHSHEHAYPASITKVATALYVLEEKKADPARMLTVSKESIRMKPLKRDWSKLPAYWLESDGTKMGLMKGEEISIDSLLHGLMLISANDAANVLAEAMSGSIDAFVKDLNRYVQSLGCRDTHFCNPHGLHHPEHLTCAFDMALIAKKAMGNSKFREIVSSLSYVKPHTNLQPEEHLRQFNHLLRRGRFHYSKAIGIKTGYTSQAQNTLVAAAELDGRVLIAVLLGCEKREDRYIDAKNLFEAAFQEQKIHRAFTLQNDSKTVAGAKCPLHAILPKELAIDYFPSEEPDYPHIDTAWSIPPLPIAKGATVGEARIVDRQGHLLGSSPLLAKEEVDASFFFILKDRISRFFQ
jgi:serine-type D-Ala-D-Ala carboxypeptidase (penicillin-binding protein 5/6)